MPAMTDRTFWDALDRLLAAHPVKIDQAAGAEHPNWPGTIYPMDYGYLEGTSSADGGGIDVWRESLGQGRIVGVLCAIAGLKRDAEIKILLDCTPDEAAAVEAFNNREDMRALVVWR